MREEQPTDPPHRPPFHPSSSSPMRQTAARYIYRTGGTCVILCVLVAVLFIGSSEGLALHAGSKRPAGRIRSSLRAQPPVPRLDAGDTSLIGLLALRGGHELAGSRSASPHAQMSQAPQEPAAPAQGPEEASKQLPSAPPAAPPAAPAGGGGTLADLFSALAGPGPAGNGGNTPPQPSVKDATPNFGVGMGRSMRALGVFNEVKADYERSIANVTDPEQRAEILEQVHARSAPKALALARELGGIYNKAAQFVASLQGGAGDRGVPRAYVDTLAVLTDEAPAKPFEVVERVIQEELGRPAAELFAAIEHTPIAAASLAQVHRATLANGTTVAVKIMYPSLRKDVASDLSVLRTMAGQIKPGGFDISWLVKDLEKALAMEMDFTREARNAEASAARLAHMVPAVKVPRVLWEHTTEGILTMEFVPGLIKLSDGAALARAALDPREVGELVATTFAEMALCHGHVHGDPHAGNIYVRARQDPAGSGCVRPQLVLLDHGLYHEVDVDSRQRLCALLLACVERRGARVQELAGKMAGPLWRFLPLLLSPTFVFGANIAPVRNRGAAGGRLSAADLAAAARHELPQSVSVREVGECIAALHASGANMLGVLHSIGYTRGLLALLAFPEQRRLQIMARFAYLGLLPLDDRDKALREGLGTLHVLQRAAVARASLQVVWSAALLRALVFALVHWQLLTAAGAVSALAGVAASIIGWGGVPFWRGIVPPVIFALAWTVSGEGGLAS